MSFFERVDQLPKIPFRGFQAKSMFSSIILAALSAFLYGSGAVAIRPVLQRTNTILVSQVTIGLNVAILGAFYFLSFHYTFNYFAVLMFVLAGICAPAFARTLNFSGIESMGAPSAIALSNSSPMYVLLLSPLVLGESLNAIVVGGTVLIMVGIVILGLDFEKPKTKMVTGMRRYKNRAFLAAGASGFLYGLSYLFRKLGIDTLNNPALGALVATATSFTILTIILGARRQTNIGFQRRVIWSLVLYGIVTSIAWILQLDSLGSGQAVVVVPILTTQPLFVIILTYLFFNRTEHLSAGVLLGALAIVGGASLLSI
jgi:uncharacterized membrane protein